MGVKVYLAKRFLHLLRQSRNLPIRGAAYNDKEIREGSIGAQIKDERVDPFSIFGNFAAQKSLLSRVYRYNPFSRM
jgi:hypothetical protein